MEQLIQEQQNSISCEDDKLEHDIERLMSKNIPNENQQKQKGQTI